MDEIEGLVLDASALLAYLHRSWLGALRIRELAAASLLADTGRKQAALGARRAVVRSGPLRMRPA
ncbi:hypothetical protein HRbin32_01666 [bacterium HR32]|nr:hypothetical protein HRbin32_01666 [bacterium HR32]